VWLIRGYTGHEHLAEFGLINMNGRMYDPQMGRVLSPDNFVQNATNTQGYNRYTYVLNNPLRYKDPSGEFFVIDDLVAAAIGGVLNLGTNLIQGNVHNFWQGLKYFGVGAVAGDLALYGPVGWMAGGAILGAGNTAIAGGNYSQIMENAFIGAFAGVVGGAAGQWAAEGLGGVVINGFNVSSPVLKGAISGAIGGAVGGYAGGFTGGIISTGDVKKANQMGLEGAATGAVVGGIVGGVAGYNAAKTSDINPWTGKANNSIVIGEGMDRVNFVTKDLGSKNISYDWPNDLPAYFDKSSRMFNPEAMDFNGYWIEIQMENEVIIYDIGTPNSTSISSPFYNMEVGRTMDYSNIVNVKYIHYKHTIRVLIIYK